jgi:hypothetical protein
MTGMAEKSLPICILQAIAVAFRNPKKKGGLEAPKGFASRPPIPVNEYSRISSQGIAEEI